MTLHQHQRASAEYSVHHDLLTYLNFDWEQLCLLELKVNLKLISNEF